MTKKYFPPRSVSFSCLVYKASVSFLTSDKTDIYLRAAFHNVLTEQTNYRPDHPSAFLLMNSEKKNSKIPKKSFNFYITILTREII